MPLLGHGARSEGAGEHAGKREDGESTGDDGGGEEEYVAALIRGRWSAGTVGTESNVVGYSTRVGLAYCPYRSVFEMSWSLRVN